MFLYFLVKNVALNTNRTPGGPSAPGVIHKRCATFISYCGIRRITTKVKTEQARNHGSYFAYARLFFRNSQVSKFLKILLFIPKSAKIEEKCICK